MLYMWENTGVFFSPPLCGLDLESRTRFVPATQTLLHCLLGLLAFEANVFSAHQNADLA